MKLLGTICTMSLFLLLGIITPADARQEQQEKRDQPAKPPKQEPQAKPEKRQEQAKGQQERQQREEQDNSAKQEQQQQAKKQQDHQQQQHQQQDKSAKQEQQQAKEQQDQQRQQRQQQDKSVKQEQQRTEQLNRPQQVSMPSRQGQHGQADQRGAWQERRAHNWQSEHHDWQQRGGYIGYRIPDDRFRGHFGRDHEFRVYTLPVLVVGGYPRFQYEGYWFSLIDPWPEYWSDDWYDSDDVYVDYSEDGYYLYNRRHQGDRIAISVYVD
jgi:hypothetical protein